ncbi:MAG TPA: ribbon-helix-helix protein, CopG family [Myxococcales bacterium]
MATIAISIDSTTKEALERLSKGRQRVRSALIRAAILEYVARLEKREREEKERTALAKHRTRLNRQLQALLSEQAKS